MLHKSLLVGVCIVCLPLMLAAATGNLRLSDAAERGDIDGVRLLLQRKADVNSAQGDGMTALHWAAFRNDVEMARILIKARADVKAGTRIGSITPLFMACTNGNAPMIELLLSAGADAGSTDALGTTALMRASASGSIDAVKLLLDHGVDVNAKETVRGQTALMFAAALDRVPVVTLLASRGANLDVTSKIVAIDKNLIDQDGNPIPAPSRTGATKQVPTGTGHVLGMGGMTALHYAAREGLIGTVQALVEAGASINKDSPLDRSSPMLVAICNGRYDVARYLLDHGADPNRSNFDGLSPLYATVDNRWAPVSWTPTQATAASGVVQQKTSHLELMEALLALGANPNAKILRTLWFNPPHHNLLWTEVAGTTPFWRAAQGTDIAAMKLLMAYGADPKISSDYGTTPLAIALGVGWLGNYSTNAPDGFLAAAKYLVEELRLDVNAADKEGYTPLMGAAWRGDNVVVQYLVDKGANLSARNIRGWAATDMANGPYLRASNGVEHPETIAFLIKLGAPNPIKVDDEEVLGTIKRKIDPVTGKAVPEKKP